MKRLNTLLLAVFALVIIFGCSKDDETENLPKEQMLAGETSKEWKYVSYSMSGYQSDDLAGEDDYPNVTFSKDGTYTETYSDGTESTGTWQFNTDKTEIVATTGSDGLSISMTYKIKSLSNDKLILQSDLTEFFKELFGDIFGDKPILVDIEYVPAS